MTWWQRRPRWQRWLLGFSFIISAVCGGLSGLAEYRIGAMGQFIVSDPATITPGRIGLVLGTNPRLADGRPNQFFHLRIQCAARLYHLGVVDGLLLSGDNSHVNYDETLAMSEALQQAGVPLAALTRDHAGLRTLDSVLRADTVFGQSTLVIISQEFHCERALYIARCHGLDAIAVAAANPTTLTAKVWLRERLARIACLWDVHIFGTQPRHGGPMLPVGRRPIAPADDR